MNDDDMLAAMRSSLAGVKDSLTDVHLDRPPEAITARARARRLRRGLTGVGAAGLALGLGLALPGGPAGQRAVHVNLAAWSVNTTSAGLIDITIRELQDPAALRQALADAGVPATVTFGQVCTGAESLPQIDQVLHKQRPTESSDVVLTVDPAAMPAGTELVIGVARAAAPGKTGSGPGLVAGFGLARDGARLTCHAPRIGKGPGNGKGPGGANPKIGFRK
jgi:hypothetical protein